MSIERDRVVVVGAGFGGLGCALDLASRGVPVRVLEQAATAGGKARAIEVQGQPVAAGPTVMTMPWVFDELFAQTGCNFREQVDLIPAQRLARHHWSDGTQMDLFADRDRSIASVREAFGPFAARDYEAFCRDAERIYGVSETYFLRGQRMTLPGIVKRFGARGLMTVVKLDAYRTMWQALESKFQEPRLRQLFARYATYVGSSPFEAPATLNLIAHVESDGVFRVDGGIPAVVAAMRKRAVDLGVEFVHEAVVDQIVIEGGRATGVLAQQEMHRGRAVVFNGDVSALPSLGAARASSETPRELRSLSSVTWAIVGRASGVPLVHHNVFFGDHYRREFEQILREERTPDEPTIYVCAQDRGDDDEARAQDRFLVIVNAPATGDQPHPWGEAERTRCTNIMTERLQRLGLTLEMDAVVQTTPMEHHARFPHTGGALYGPRSKGSLSMLNRRGAKTKIPGLYLAGGSVHPGPGVPMATLSGRLAGEQMSADLRLPVPSHPVATTGITSTG
ncbi:MAG: phytoene desaturase family protein [Myxococcota bacterium]